MRIVLALLLIMVSGCSVLPTGMGLEAKHDSGLLTDGHDSDGLLKEDSLDVINGYLYWERPASDRLTWYTEAGVGYKVREGGFYVKDSKWTGNARTGLRFRFTRPK